MHRLPDMRKARLACAAFLLFKSLDRLLSRVHKGGPHGRELLRRRPLRDRKNAENAQAEPIIKQETTPSPQGQCRSELRDARGGQGRHQGRFEVVPAAQEHTPGAAASALPTAIAAAKGVSIIAILIHAIIESILINDGCGEDPAAGQSAHWAGLACPTRCKYNDPG